MSDDFDMNDLTEFVEELVELAGWDLKTSIAKVDNNIVINLTGEDRSFLLGRNGEVLNALEHLANKIYLRTLPREVRISFDCHGFRSMRTQELQLMAKHAAEFVRRTKKTFTFEPMSAPERRIVHLALVEQNELRTESQGEGEDRKVSILLN